MIRWKDAVAAKSDSLEAAAGVTGAASHGCMPRGVYAKNKSSDIAGAQHEGQRA